MNNNNRVLKMTALAAALALISACTEQKSEAEYIASASQYVDAGNNKAAIVEYKNALKLNGSNAEVRAALARAYLASGNFAAADKEYERALGLDVADPRVRVEAVRTKLALQDIDGALKLTDDLSQQAPAEQLVLGILRGQALLSKGLTDDAKLEFEQANSLDPQAAYGQLGSAYLQAIAQQDSEALEILSQLLQQHPELSEAWLLQGRLQLASRQTEAAIDSFTQLVKQEPNILGYQVLLAQAQIAANRLDDAKAQLEQLEKVTKDHPLTSYLQSLVAFRQSDCERSQLYAQKVLKVQPRHFGARLLSGYCYYLGEQNEQAYAMLTGVAPRTPAGHPARKALAVTQYRLGYHQQAAETVKGFEPSSDEDYQFMSQLGAAMMREGEAGIARELFSRALTSEEPSSRDRLRLGVAKLQLDDASGMDDLLGVLEDQPENKEARVIVVLNLLKQKQFSEATAQAKAWYKAEPDSVDARNLLAAVYLEQGQYAEAEPLLDAVLKAEPGNRNANYQRLQLALAQQHYDQALSYLGKLVEVAPLDRELITQWYRLAKQQDQVPKVVEHLSAYRTQQQGRLLLAELYEAEGDTDKALTELGEFIGDENEFADYAKLKSRLLLRQRQFGPAEALALEWQKQSPADARAALQLSEVYELQNEYDKAINAIRSGLNQHPNGEALKIQLASLWLKNGETEQAASLIAELKRSTEPVAHLNELEGRLLLAQSKPAQAKPLLLQALAERPALIRALYAGQALLENGDNQQAVDTLSPWLSRYQSSGLLRMQLAQAYVTVDPTAAEEHYSYVLEQQPDNVQVLNNLAWLKAERGAYQEALPLAERAMDKMPGSPQVLDTLGEIYLNLGRADEALQVLQKATDKQPGDGDIRFHYAQALVKSGDEIRAKAVLDQLLASATAFGSRSEAQALRERLQ